MTSVPQTERSCVNDMAKVTIQKLKEMKQKKERITMVTAYDYPSAVLV